ncbi:hypothetical protein G6F57_021553 [Rhizopus arrhizus]|nr:hypothetical protein G6F57_021553 [Rhizopus arrhizus]
MTGDFYPRCNVIRQPRGDSDERGSANDGVACRHGARRGGPGRVLLRARVHRRGAGRAADPGKDRRGHRADGR